MSRVQVNGGFFGAGLGIFMLATLSFLGIKTSTLLKHRTNHQLHRSRKNVVDDACTQK